MTKHEIYNTNVADERILISPAELKKHLPNSTEGEEVVWQGRQTIKNILTRKDHRLCVVVGPCSIHDMDSAKEYAERLKKLHDELSDSLYIVMRIYFEKPRTTVGWKGLINDPYMDDSFRIEEGLHKGRQLLLWLAEVGLPSATEALDPISPQYMSDLFAWAAIGARTTESQTHREMASGLSMPVGFKNGTDGSLEGAVNAMVSAAEPHSFLGIDVDGASAVIKTAGNPDRHLVLRAGQTRFTLHLDPVTVHGGWQLDRNHHRLTAERDGHLLHEDILIDSPLRTSVHQAVATLQTDGPPPAPDLAPLRRIAAIADLLRACQPHPSRTATAAAVAVNQ